MSNFISTTDVAIWIVLVAARLVLCLLILKKDLFRRTRWFSVYVIASTVESILLFAVAFLFNYSVYYYVFYTTSHLVSLLAFLTLLECGRRVLPGLNLPQKEKAITLFVIALFAGIAFAALWPMRYIEKRIDLATYLMITIAFVFTAIYSRYLGLRWSRLIAGISSTLAFLYLVQAVTRAITAHYPAPIFIPVRQLSQVANVLAVIAWIVVVLSPWGVREMTEADVLKIEAAFAKIEASLGAGGVKTV